MEPPPKPPEFVHQQVRFDSDFVLGGHSCKAAGDTVMSPSHPSANKSPGADGVRETQGVGESSPRMNKPLVD